MDNSQNWDFLSLLNQSTLESVPNDLDLWLGADFAALYGQNPAAQLQTPLAPAAQLPYIQTPHKVQPLVQPSTPSVAAVPPTPSVTSSSINESERTTEDDAHASSKDFELMDKRRRNTAASARFRARKKLREQAMAMTAREMTVKVQALESKLREYEMEIRWLRGLVTDKNLAKPLSQIYAENGLTFVPGVSAADLPQ